MLQFLDPSVREGAALRHALLTSSGTSAAAAKRALDAAMARGAPEVQRFALQLLIKDAVTTRFWADVAAENTRLVLLREHLQGVLQSPGRIGLFADAFETVEVSESLVADFLGSDKLHLSPSDQLAVIVGLTYAANEGTRTTGRKLLAKRLAEVTTEEACDKWVASINDDVTVRAVATAVAGDVQFQGFAKLMAQHTNMHGPTLAAPKELHERTDCHVTLAAFIEELGPIAVATPEDAAETLGMYPWPVTAREVAGCLALFMRGAPGRHDTGSWSSVRTALSADGTAPKKGAAPSGTPAWAHATFVDAVVAADATLDWNTVLAKLDAPCTEQAAAAGDMQLSVLIAGFRKATGHLPPVLPFLQPWSHAPRAQLQALKFYAANPDAFERKGLLSLPASLTPSQAASAEYTAAWHSPSFVAALLDCAAFGGHAVEREVTTIVLAAAKVAPAAVAASLLVANTQRSLRTHKVISDVLLACGVPACLTAECVDFVFKQNRGPLMLRTLTNYIAADHGRAASVLPVLQQGRLFPRILAVAADPVVHVMLAISGQECGHVPTHYLSDALGANASAHSPRDMPVSRVPLAMATVDVCDDLVSKGGTVSVALRTALNAVANSGLAPVIPSVVAHARSLISAAHAFGGNDPSADDTEHVQEQFPPEIENTAASLVEAACKTTDPTSAHDIRQCTELRDSANEKKRMLLRCVGKTVLEEAACVNQYPPSALSNFSRFFGLLVKNDLLEPGDMKMALRIVLQSVVAPSDPRMRDFGVTALGHFKSRLPEWPAFRRSLRQAPDLDMYLPGIIAYLNAADKSDQERQGGANGTSPAGSPTGANGDGKAPVDATAHLHQHDIRTLLSDSNAPQPSSVARDRINFILGNTDTNMEKMEAHARELKSLVTSEYFQYFAEYLVVKRVALEPNNHKTYLQLVELLDSPDLESKLRRATIVACRRLIESDKVRTNSSERSLLKSLGSWLGQLTLARNVPVLARDLDLRELIPNALRDGKLIAIVPFLAKLIEHSANSRAFRIPNPLIMSLLGQLAEMYHLDDLKITLRFEVEVLCRNLHVAINELVEFAQKERPHREPLHEVKRRSVDVANSNDFRPANPDDSSEPVRTKLTADAAPYEPKVGGSSGGPSQGPGVHTDLMNQVLSHHMMRQASNMPVAHFLQITDLNAGRELQNIPQQHHAQYRAMLKHAFDSGLLETHGALDRSAAVACNTAREIAAKDFSRERNDNALSFCAHAMARGLATTLVSVSARDTAFNLIRKHLGQQLPRVFTPETVNDVIENLLNENAAGITSALEEATLEITAIKMDAELGRLFDERHQAWRTSERCHPREHVSPQTAKALAELPETLRPNSSLYPYHVAVYASFLPPRVDNTVDQVVQLLQVIEEAALRHYTECPPTDSANVLSLTNVSFTETTQSEHHDTIKRKLVEVSQWITETNAVPLLVNLFPRIMLLAEKVQAESRNPSAHNTVMHHGNLLLNEVCLFVLQAIREKGQGKAVAELMRLYSIHDKRWVNKELAANLIRLRLMDIAEFDRVLTKALQEPNRQQAVEFAGYIVQKCLIEGKLANVRDLKHTLEILEQIADQSKKQRAPTRMRVPTMHKQPYRQEIEKYFDEWLQICDKKPGQQNQQQPPQQPPAAAGQEGQPPQQQQQQSKQVIALNFVKKLQDSGMLKADTMLDHFFGVLTELAIEDYATAVMLSERALTAEQRAAKERARPEITRGQVHPPPARLAADPRAFVAVDAFSDLIVVLIKCCAWSSRREDSKQQQGHAETALIQRVLSVVGRALTFNHDWCVDRNGVDRQYHEQPPLPEGCALEETHLQQPFMRLISNLMIALAPSADERGDFWIVVANTLHALNPQRLPGFAFAWVELIGHRLFISKMMRSQETWPLYHKLLNDALRFVEPFARPQGMSEALVLYFKCVLKLMLLLLHDFSEFLLAHHQLLCDAIPPCCIQLRNIVLSAFPRQTKLPDPFARSGRYNQLPELRQPPTMAPAVKDPYSARPQLQMPVPQADFDQYLATKQPADVPQRLVQALSPADGKGYNVPLLSAVVLYAGARTVERQAPLVKEAFEKAEANKTTVDPDPITFNRDMGAAEILRTLLASFNSEGRYHVINACVNQLRFPNAHTHFFCLALQHVFANASPHQEHIQEHVTRVLVERLIISRPHPWGLLITFFDIVKDAKNEFWEKPFIRCTPEIERMFESVAQSVHPQQQQQQQQQPQPAQQPAPQGTAPQQPQAPQQPRS